MSRAGRAIVDADLHAYVDGQLSPAEQRDIERHLATDPAAAARTARWIADRDALRARLAPTAEETPPLRLNLARIHPRSAARGGAGRRLAIAFAFLAGLAAGLAIAGALALRQG